MRIGCTIPRVIKARAPGQNAGSAASFGSMLGITAFEDKVYGFSRKGDIVEIHNTDGTGCLISSDKNNLYAGAGITTTAPVVAPPK